VTAPTPLFAFRIERRTFASRCRRGDSTLRLSQRHEPPHVNDPVPGATFSRIAKYDRYPFLDSELPPASASGKVSTSPVNVAVCYAAFVTAGRSRQSEELCHDFAGQPG